MSSAPPVSLERLLSDATAALSTARVPSPETDAQLLAAHVLGLGRGELRARALTGLVVATEAAERFAALVDRRAARVPLQHLTGRAPFRTIELEVGPGVFVPRPETELLVQIAIDALRAVAAPAPRAVDLGTGSGAIALALAVEVPHAEIDAVEVDPEAYIYATGNRRRLGVDNLALHFGDLAHALPEVTGVLDVVVSNPPYIPDAAIPRDPEVRMHDPARALYSGADGLDAMRAVSQTALRLLREGGLLAVEHGDAQGAEVRELFTRDGWHAAATHRDATGRDRVTTAMR